jgi:hypothetical protein
MAENKRDEQHTDDGVEDFRQSMLPTVSPE